MTSSRCRRSDSRSSTSFSSWRTIAGDEGSGYFPGGSAQYHINAAIAYAVRIYDRATGDDAFVLGEAAPMVFETARLWLDVGTHDSRRGGAFSVCEVTGHDEYTALIDDDQRQKAKEAALEDPDHRMKPEWALCFSSVLMRIRQ